MLPIHPYTVMLSFCVGSTYANNCSHCNLDCSLYPKLEQTNGMLQRDMENCRCCDVGEVDNEDDTENEAPLFSLTKR